MKKIKDETIWKLLRTILLTGGLLLLLVLSVSYAVARNFEKGYYRTVYFYLLMGLFILFQVIMLPVTKMMTKLNLMNHTGLIILYSAFGLTQGVFLFVNYIRGRSVKKEALIVGRGMVTKFIGNSIRMPG